MASQGENVQGESGVTVASGNVAEVYGNIVGNISIGGNISDTVVIGNNNIVVNSDHGTIIYQRPLQPAKAPPTTGKGIWIGRLELAESGNLGKIRDRAVTAEFSHLVIKVADGANIVGSPELFTQLNKLLAEVNIRLFGFHYVYGKDIKAEARTAVELLSTLPLDGYIINAETEFTSVEPTNAEELMSRIREKAGEGRLGLSSFRYPSYQPLPWEALLKEADFLMPQIYWENASNPGAQLERSVSEFQRIRYDLPIIPIGSAYVTGSWRPKPDEIAEFLETAEILRLPGVGFWNWDTAGLHEHQDIWETIANYQWNIQSKKRQSEKHPNVDHATTEATNVSFVIPQPKLESRVLQIVHNDEVDGVDDKLGYNYFVDSFVQLIMDPGTRPPLTIGISGAWGSGKTFILSRVRDTLLEQK